METREQEKTKHLFFTSALATLEHGHLGGEIGEVLLHEFALVAGALVKRSHLGLESRHL